MQTKTRNRIAMVGVAAAWTGLVFWQGGRKLGASLGAGLEPGPTISMALPGTWDLIDARTSTRRTLTNAVVTGTDVQVVVDDAGVERLRAVSWSISTADGAREAAFDPDQLFDTFAIDPPEQFTNFALLLGSGSKAPDPCTTTLARQLTKTCAADLAQR